MFVPALFIIAWNTLFLSPLFIAFQSYTQPHSYPPHNLSSAFKACFPHLNLILYVKVPKFLFSFAFFAVTTFSHTPVLWWNSRSVTKLHVRYPADFFCSDLLHCQWRNILTNVEVTSRIGTRYFIWKSFHQIEWLFEILSVQLNSCNPSLSKYYNTFVLLAWIL